MLSKLNEVCFKKKQDMFGVQPFQTSKEGNCKHCRVAMKFVIDFAESLLVVYADIYIYICLLKFLKHGMCGFSCKHKLVLHQNVRTLVESL